MGNNKQSLTIYIHNHCGDFIGEDFFLTGNMVNWKVDGIYLGKVPAIGGNVEITLEDISIEDLELKINRGTWQTLTANTNGHLLPVYQVEDTNTSDLHIHIEAWRDQYTASTASPQVQLMTSSFYFPRLDVTKEVWIYLPKGYKESDKRYPVLYMHDGQHLFDEATSQGRTGPVEWKVDKAIDASDDDAIVIAIAHGDTLAQRHQEYLLFPLDDMQDPKGEDYLHDIVHTLKPFVDEHYRTRKEKHFTAMAGSSLGGLLSLEAGLLHSTVFGYLGVFSPSIWTSEENVNQLFASSVAQARENIDDQGYFYYAGGAERRRGEQGEVAQMLTHMLSFSAMHRAQTSSVVQVEVDEQGKHGAHYWQQIFPLFFACWQSYMQE